MNRIALLGASRGLGWAVYSEFLKKNVGHSYFLSSRKILERKNQTSGSTTLKPQDFSKLPVNPQFLKDLQDFKPTEIIYIAGGGPYGDFQTKKWSDHQWALATTFLYPAELLHSILSHFEAWSGLKQIVFVGSAVAQDKPDPRASSYAAAKHALHGLITSVQLEGLKIPEIRLFSPGYMQTDLLPRASWPKQQGLAEPVEEVAIKLIDFIEKTNQR